MSKPLNIFTLAATPVSADNWWSKQSGTMIYLAIGGRKGPFEDHGARLPLENRCPVQIQIQNKILNDRQRFKRNRME